LRRHGYTHVNYLSVDTKGYELDVLRSIDFDYTTFDVIELPESETKFEINSLLEGNGYKFARKLGEDILFYHQSFTSAV